MSDLSSLTTVPEYELKTFLKADDYLISAHPLDGRNYLGYYILANDPAGQTLRILNKLVGEATDLNMRATCHYRLARTTLGGKPFHIWRKQLESEDSDNG